MENNQIGVGDIVIIAQKWRRRYFPYIGSLLVVKTFGKEQVLNVEVQDLTGLTWIIRADVFHVVYRAGSC